MVNTPRGPGAQTDGADIRRAANRLKVSVLTTVAAALAAAEGLEEWVRGGRQISVKSLQEHLQR